jgi:cytochrome P450
VNAQGRQLVHRRGHWLLGSLPAFRGDRLRFFEDNARLAPIVHFRLGPKRVYFLSEPELVQDMLVTQHQHLARDPTARRILAPTMGNGLLTSDGDYWKRQRRMIAPAMHLRRVQRFADLMVRHAADATGRWRDRQQADVEREMDRLTLAIVTDALFRLDSARHADVVAETITTLQQIGNRQLAQLVLLPAWVPTADNLKQRRLSRRLRRIVLSAIKARRAAPSESDDLLTALVQGRDPETGEQMTDEQICDEVITLHLAGYDTTALSLTYCWYQMALHPEIEARFHAELDQVLAGRPPRLDDMEQLDYTQRVFKEVLRLYPPAYFAVRLVARDIEIGGHPIPAGSILMTSSYAMHRKPELWDEPDRFDPERFADNAEQAWPRFKYFPFGGGPRICIGNQFALLEGPLILATIGQRYRFELLQPRQRLELEPQITLGPKGGMPLRFRRREPLA